MELSRRQTRFAGFLAGAFGTIVVGLFLTVAITGNAFGVEERKIPASFIEY
ncbi:hypothetical protein AADZ90_012280 [Aestuariibius sp. 2305UL40-4]|uniref:hypothetical protein n=1 Tax=Aestuariibius violaceus TaxID=3234132 RepID=UPI00345E95B0